MLLAISLLEPVSARSSQLLCESSERASVSETLLFLMVALNHRCAYERCVVRSASEPLQGLAHLQVDRPMHGGVECQR